jgi:hypothetical protein
MLYCSACWSVDDCCECGDESVLVDAYNCDNCGSICSEDEIDYRDLCADCASLQDEEDNITEED